MVHTKPTLIELDMSTLEDALRRAEERLDEPDYAMLKALAEAYAYLSELVGDNHTTICSATIIHSLERQLEFLFSTRGVGAVLWSAAEQSGPHAARRRPLLLHAASGGLGRLASSKR
jgi:hypothetical protein